MEALCETNAAVFMAKAMRAIIINYNHTVNCKHRAIVGRKVEAIYV